MAKFSAKKDKNRNISIAVLVVAFFLLGFSVSPYIQPKDRLVEVKENNIVKFLYKSDKTGSATVRIPAVDEEGKGVITELTVQAMQGSGRVLANIDKLLFWVDTQNSIRTARDVAQNYTRINLAQYDIVYTVEADEASVIEGGSAGAALTAATIAALQNKTIRPDVVISGTINHDGTIGPVGEILAKAKAAKAGNASVFLVPAEQGKGRTYKTERHCEKKGPAQLCTLETVAQEIDISKEAGLPVLEVLNIEEALKELLA